MPPEPMERVPDVELTVFAMIVAAELETVIPLVALFVPLIFAVWALVPANVVESASVGGPPPGVQLPDVPHDPEVPPCHV